MSSATTCRTEHGILDHQGQNVDEQITRRNARHLRDSVIGGTDLDDIRTHQPDAFEPLDKPLHFPGGPATALGGAGGRSDAGIKHVDVNAEVDGGVAHDAADFVDDACDADVVDLVGFDQGEADVVAVDHVVVRTEQFGAQPAVHRRALGDAAFTGCVPEESPVRDGRLLRDNPRVPRVRVPGVEVRVEVDDGDGPVDLLEAAQDGEHDRVVASEAEDARLWPGRS